MTQLPLELNATGNALAVDIAERHLRRAFSASDLVVRDTNMVGEVERLLYVARRLALKRCHLAAQRCVAIFFNFVSGHQLSLLLSGFISSNADPAGANSRRGFGSLPGDDIGDTRDVMACFSSAMPPSERT